MSSSLINLTGEHEHTATSIHGIDRGPTQARVTAQSNTANPVHAVNDDDDAAMGDARCTFSDSHGTGTEYDGIHAQYEHAASIHAWSARSPVSTAVQPDSKPDAPPDANAGADADADGISSVVSIPLPVHAHELLISSSPSSKGGWNCSWDSFTVNALPFS